MENNLKSLIGFVKLVEDMRLKQKSYFHTRQKEILIESKYLEKEVDSAILILKELKF